MVEKEIKATKLLPHLDCSQCPCDIFQHHNAPKGVCRWKLDIVQAIGKILKAN